MFESGRLEDGAAYIVMEYLEGELLSMRLQKAVRLPTRTALTLGRQIASALAAAHSKRIVHRVLILPSKAAARLSHPVEDLRKLYLCMTVHTVHRTTYGTGT